jgi:hypothetical protein
MVSGRPDLEAGDYKRGNAFDPGYLERDMVPGDYQ